MQTADYIQVVICPNGFVVADKSALDPDTIRRIEAQGYIVIEKRGGKSVEIIYHPSRPFIQSVSYPQAIN